jgi:undecaprenyl-diphosphatase
VIAGSLAAVATSLFAVLFLTRYFRTRTLMPVAAYSLAFGMVSAVGSGIF